MARMKSGASGRVHYELTLLLLSVALSAPGARADTTPDKAAVSAVHPVDRRPPRPGTDFPSLDSYYPAAAKRAGQEGTAVIHFCTDADGELTEPPRITTSSGNAVIDAAAVNLAAVGSGHYLPASEHGVPVPGCGEFRIAFKLRKSAFLPMSDPRIPTISARITQLNAEFSRRMQDLVSQVDRPSGQIVLAPGDPAVVRVIRQYARALDAFLDQSVGLSADFLEDVDYLARSPDIPEPERVLFAQDWPEERAAVAAEFREMLGAMRDIVRALDELADYIGFSAPRRTHADTAADTPTPEQDPQFIAIRERARKAMERVRDAMKNMGADPQSIPH